MSEEQARWLSAEECSEQRKQYRGPEVGPCAHLEETSKEASVALDCVEPEKSSKR